jgi:hypothetical protein
MPSGDIFAGVTLQPVVTTLTSVVKPMDIVNLFATGVAASIVLVLVWFGCKWIYGKFVKAVRGGRG